MDLLEDAREELKRADHLVYVSLKYTRTCDIIMNTVKRLIESCNFVILALLENLRDKRKIDSIPEGAFSRAELLLEKDKKYKNYIKLYQLLNKIKDADFERREEYRKHVTMICHLDRRDLEVDVLTLEEYFSKAKEFVDIAEDELG
jgi:hypothetical protein